MFANQGNGSASEAGPPFGQHLTGLVTKLSWLNEIRNTDGDVRSRGAVRCAAETSNRGSTNDAPMVKVLNSTRLMRRILRWAALSGWTTAVLLIVISGLTQARAHTQQPKVPLEIEELLWWLPPDTETVQVTQTPPNPRGPLFGGIAHTRGEIEGGDESYSEILTRHLKGTRVKATVDGSRRFAPPSGLGAMLYEGAMILRFDKPLGAAGTRLIAELGKRALKIDRFDGLEILEFRDKLESDYWNSYIAVPSADVLVIATNRPYLEELLRRRKARTLPRALPENLSEWQWLDVTAPYWALRHFRRDAANDPTSLSGRPNVLGGFDAAALGVTAYVNADGRTIVAHYVSPAANADQTARRLWAHPGDGVSPAVRRVSANAIEARLVAKDEEDLAMFFFYLLAALGHATVL